MGREQTSTIEQEVRRVLVNVLTEVADELSAATPDEPTGSGGTNGASRAFSSAGRMPGRGSNGSGGAAVPRDVLEAVKSVYQDLPADQASSLAEMFEAIASNAEGAEPDDDEMEDDFEDEEPGAKLSGLSSAGAEDESAFELESMSAAKAEGQRVAAGGLRLVISLLKKQGPRVIRAAARAAKRGKRAFVKWVGGLSNFNPLKWAIKALPNVVLMQLLEWLSSYRARERQAA